MWFYSLGRCKNYCEFASTTKESVVYTSGIFMRLSLLYKGKEQSCFCCSCPLDLPLFPLTSSGTHILLNRPSYYLIANKRFGPWFIHQCTFSYMKVGPMAILKLPPPINSIISYFWCWSFGWKLPHLHEV